MIDLGIGIIDIDRKEFHSACHHLIDDLERSKHILLLGGGFLHVHLCLEIFHLVLDGFLPCHDRHCIKVFAADCHICRVVLDRIVELIPRKAHGGDNIRCGVSLREHIFYFKTAVDIPLGDIVRAHRRLVFVGKELFRFTLTGYLHYLERHARLDALMYEIGHDAVSCSDNVGNGAGAVIDKVFCVAEPDVGAVGKSRYLEHIGKVLRF